MNGIRKLLAGVSVIPGFEIQKLGVSQPSKGARLRSHHSHEARIMSKKLSSKKISSKRYRV